MKNTFIGTGTVIGDGAIIMEGASIKRSIVYPNAEIHKNCELRGCVICPHAQIRENAGIFEGSVIGEKTVIGENAVIDAGANIWPGKMISEGRRISQSIVWGQKARDDFSGLSIRIKTPQDAVSAAQACACKMNAPVCILARSTSAVAANQARAFASGLISEGVQVYDMGEATLPVLLCALQNTFSNAGYYVTGDSVTPIGSNALPICDSEKRAIAACLSRQDAPLPYTLYTSRLESAGRFDLVYLKHLETAVRSPLRRLRAAVHSNREQLLYYAENVLKRLNYACRVEWEEELMTLDEDEIGVFLSDDGRKAAFGIEGRRLSDAENEMLLTWALFERGETTVFAPPIATHALDEIASMKNGEVEYFKDERELMDRLSKSSPVQFAARTDGIYAFLLVLDVLSDKNMLLNALLSEFPHVYRVKNDLPLPDEKRAAMLGNIRKHTPENFEREEGFYKNADGYAWLKPDEKRPVLSVVSEARDMETAQEICDVFSDVILHSMEN